MNLISFACFVLSVLMLIGTKNTDYNLLFLEPLIYGICYHFNKPLRQNKFSHIALGILFITSIIKYVITPFVTFLADYPSIEFTLDKTYLVKAILLQCYEEICFFIVLRYAATKFYKSDMAHNTLATNRVYVQHHNPFLWFVVVAALAVIFTTPSMISRYHFVGSLVGNEEEDIVNIEGTGGLGLLISAGRYFLVLLMLAYVYNKRKVHRNIDVILSIIIVAINSMVVYDFSRFGIIIPAATFIYLITLLYPQKRKEIIIFSVFAIGASVVYTSFIKMFSEYRGNVDDSSDIGYWAKTLQVYFQGTNDVAIGLMASEKAVLSPIMSFFNDCIANVAVLSHFSVRQFTSLYIFNYMRSGGVSFDKILPNICASYNYFGLIGAPIIVCVCTYFGIKFDSMSRKARDINYKFIFIFASLTLALCHMTYYTMIVSSFVNTVLIMLVILRLNKLFK